MAQRVSRCAFAVSHATFDSDTSPRICEWRQSYFPCGLVAGKSLVSVAIVVENAFRPVNGRLVGFRPRVLFKSLTSTTCPQQSPHGGTVRMAGCTQGRVRATVILRRWSVQSRLRWIYYPGMHNRSDALVINWRTTRSAMISTLLFPSNDAGPDSRTNDGHSTTVVNDPYRSLRGFERYRLIVVRRRHPSPVSETIDASANP
jgi:hypothetical protein